MRKKIIVPVQLCVLSTGFPQLSPEVSPPICTTFPSLFPKQIDEESIDPNPCPKPRFSLESEEFVEEEPRRKLYREYEE